MNSILLKLPQLSLVKSGLVALALVCTAILTLVITPTLHSVEHTPDFEAIIPQQFGDWKTAVDPFAQVSLSTNPNDLVNQIYDSTLMRTYVNSRGDRVMLALAYAREQKQDVKIHRPEVCYVAQGFQKLSQVPSIITIDPSEKPVLGNRILMRNDNRFEAVSYWIRIGDDYPSGGFDSRLKILKAGLKGKILDGILVRASMTVNDESGAAIAYEKQEQFLSDLIASLDMENINFLVASR